MANKELARGGLGPPPTPPVFSRTPVLVAVALFCCALWGSAHTVIKVGADSFGVVQSHAPSMILFAGMRFFLAGWMALALGSLIQRRWLKLRRQSVMPAVKLSLVQTVGQYVLFYVGLGITSSTRSAILNGAAVFVTLLVACLVFKTEKLTLRKSIGSLLAVAGVIIMNVSDSAAAGSLLGDALLLGSTLAYAASSAMIKRYSEKEDPVTLSGWQFVIGGAVMVAVGLLLGGRVSTVSTVAVLALLYLGFLSAAAYSLWGVLLRYNPVSKVVVFTATTPLFGVLISAIVPANRTGILTWVNLAALVAVVAGALIVNTAKKDE